MKSPARSLVLSGLMTALTAALSLFSIPIGSAALTLQTFSVALTGYLLPPRAAFLSVFAYLLLGSCGLPVFSNFQGGPGVLLGPTGGFLIGFPFMALMCSASRNRPRLRLTAGLAGLLMTYTLGAAQLSHAAQIGIREAILTGVAPFLLKDTLSIWCADALGRALSRRLHRLR